MTIKAVLPFDFELSASIFSEGDKQIRRYENGKFYQVIRINNKLVLISAKSSGSRDEIKLLVDLESNEEISNRDRKKIREVIYTIFNLELDLEKFYQDVKKDKIMSMLTQKLRGLKIPTTPTVFEALVDSIIEQQISLRVAHSLERKVTKTFGDILKVDDQVYYVFPTPQKIASATVEQLRECGLSYKKAEYIRDIAKMIAEGTLDLEKFKDYENIDEIINDLSKIRGIGVWTAELTMLRGMQKFEAIPADDLGLRRVISHYYCNDRKISGEEARRIAQNWGKWKGLAAFYLITAERLKIEI
ncbi:MAG: DNA-3-methyladenine glycosylase 2 [Candidatus Jordarchaeum sp.]|uniref:DNA-3-methyladenine glycosylase 2 n=1 Tax=Candidatus Jordarchaeum sp. TaxID=2823881 RepID=UPI00404A701E